MKLDMRHGSSVSIELGYGLDNWGSISNRGSDGFFFLFFTASRPAVPLQWVPGTFNLGVERLGCEADRSPPTSAEVNNAWMYISIPQ